MRESFDGDDRHGWLEYSNAVCRSIPGRGTASEPIFPAFHGCRDQLVVLQVAPTHDLRSVGRQRPGKFRFAIKLPREVTHVRKLVDAAEPLAQFFDEIAPLNGRLGPVLVQLPPSLAYNVATAEAFLRLMRQSFTGQVAWEPRHASWFEPDADALLCRYEIARVAADPGRVSAAARPGGWPGLAYYRLHGSPRTYYSSYDSDHLDQLAIALARRSGSVWCIFDNTASGAAASNALDLL